MPELLPDPIHLEYGLFALGQSFGQVLTYCWDIRQIRPQSGRFFKVPLRSKWTVGLFLDRIPKPSYACKEVASELDHIPELSAQHLKLMTWLSEYYLSPLGSAAAAVVPGFVWGLAEKDWKASRSSSQAGSRSGNRAHKQSKAQNETQTETQKQISLSTEQAQALETCLSARPTVTLLRGVTGSGKTEVYLEAVQRVLAQQKTVLVMVPEISLSPQMEDRFRAHFGARLAVLHSGLAQGLYQQEWRRVALGEAEVVLGVRSSVFAPLKNLGLVVVDEEHDSSYKCADAPCYNARDVAVKRASMEGALCVLGSATPSLESYLNAQSGRYGYATLKSRHSSTRVTWDWVDLRLSLQRSARKAQRARDLQSSQESLSPEIVTQIRDNKHAGYQTMVILNRRGFAHFATCGSCGENLKCPSCSVSTTLHKMGQTEICHYCGFQIRRRYSCPSCGSQEFIEFGMGTQSLEMELQEKIPELKIDRLDRDVLTSETRLSSILEKFRSGETDCLVGTQMLSKGHDFPRVSLVVLLHLEESLHLPDFRSRERTFQLISQSAGRAGRAETPGKVLLQSLSKEVPLAKSALQGEIESFLAEEKALRSMAHLPPFVRQILFEINDKSNEKAFERACLVREKLLNHWKIVGLGSKDAKIVGPVPAMLEKIKGVYRFHISLALSKSVLPNRAVPEELWTKRVQGFQIDVDPLNFQ